MLLIYGSKLFKASSDVRKQRILAAMNNPINEELIAQVIDQVQTVDTSDNDLERPQTAGKSHSNNAATNKSTPPHSAYRTPSSAQFDSSLDDTEIDPTIDELNDVPDFKTSNTDSTSTTDDVDDDEDVQNDNTNTNPNIDSSTHINASSEIGPMLPETLKGLLNVNSSTAGVNRVLIKADELWIYYDDSINLNNVMTAVIESLNAANYYYLVFNRLARTDNAIVFEISKLDTNQSMNPVTDDSNNE